MNPCIYTAEGEKCPQEAVHDGLCEVHLKVVEISETMQQAIVALLVEFEGVGDQFFAAQEIMNRIVGPVMDRQVLSWVKTALVEKSLRDDFGALADDLESVRQGEMSDAKKQETLLSWEKTAEILRDKQLSDQLDQAKLTVLDESTEVERP